MALGPVGNISQYHAKLQSLNKAGAGQAHDRINKFNAAMDRQQKQMPDTEQRNPSLQSHPLESADRYKSVGNDIVTTQAVSPAPAPQSIDKLSFQLNMDTSPALASHKAERDTILHGLTRLREAFDAREQRINRLMSSTGGGSEVMFSMQAATAEYALIVDAASKLAGKTTQAIDTLLKGQ